MSSKAIYFLPNMVPLHFPEIFFDRWKLNTDSLRKILSIFPRILSHFIFPRFFPIDENWTWTEVLSIFPRIHCHTSISRDFFPIDENWTRTHYRKFIFPRIHCHTYFNFPTFFSDRWKLRELDKILRLSNGSVFNFHRFEKSREKWSGTKLGGRCRHQSDMISFLFNKFVFTFLIRASGPATVTCSARIIQSWSLDTYLIVFHFYCR